MEFMLAKWEEQKGEAREWKTTAATAAKDKKNERAERSCYFKRFISSRKIWKLFCDRKFIVRLSAKSVVVEKGFLNMRKVSNDFHMQN